MWCFNVNRLGLSTLCANKTNKNVKEDIPCHELAIKLKNKKKTI